MPGLIEKTPSHYPKKTRGIGEFLCCALLGFWYQHRHSFAAERARNFKVTNRSRCFPRAFHLQASTFRSTATHHQIRK